MNRIAFPPRFLIYVIGLLILIACGGGVPAAAPHPSATGQIVEAAEPLPEEPAEAGDEPSAEEAQPTQGGLLDMPPVLIAPTTVPLHPDISVPFPPTAQPALPERRHLTLEFPPQIRAGDSDRVRLTLEVDDLGNLTPTAEVTGSVVAGEILEIPNLYDTHNTIAEAQFDITGLQISPAGRVSQSLLPGQSVTFFWSIHPSAVGVYRGTIWFYLRFVDKVSGEQSEKAISAQPVDIEAVNFLGLSVNSARLFGAVGSVVGTVLGFPFLEDIVRFMFGRRRLAGGK